MRGNRVLVVIALILIVLVLAAGGVYFFVLRPGATPTEETPEGTPTEEFAPVDYTEIVVAAQSIPRGMEILSEELAIELRPWPNDYLPLEYFTSLAEVDGKIARMDIPRGLPVLPDMLGRPGGMLAVEGSAAALFSMTDRVAYAIPMDTQGAVAWALKPGDHVDVIAALQMIAVSSESVTEGVKQFTYLEEEGMPGQTSLFGRFELLPNGRWAAIYSVNAESNLLPNLLVQLTVQDAIVWHIGVWEDTAEQAVVTPAAPEGAEEGGGGMLGGGVAEEATPPPAPTQRQDIEPVTLLVTREEALVIKYLIEMGADLDLVLRPAGYTDDVIQSQPVWFRYILDKYNLPTSMPDESVGPSPVRNQPLELLPQATPEPEGE